MKHKLQVTLILIVMFIITQIIGLLVVNVYLPQQKEILNQTTGEYQNITISPLLPYGMQPPELRTQTDFWTILPGIILSFVIAIVIIFLISRIKIHFLLRYWFFVVVILAIGISFNALFLKLNILSVSVNLLIWQVPLAWLIALIIAIPLAIYKIFKRNLIVHNLTELIIYPGIAAVFVPILNIWTAILFLVLISVYDMWAVWRSGIMQRMAKFQMNEVKIFGGFFVPYISKKVRAQIARLKNSKLKKKRIKINLAILGGGDVVFPIITSGVFLKFYGVIPAIFVVIGATIALSLLFIFSDKKKFYPAMPFISSGIFIALLVWKLLF